MPNGFRSVPPTTYARHNPPGQDHVPRLAGVRPPVAPLRPHNDNLQQPHPAPVLNEDLQEDFDDLPNALFLEGPLEDHAMADRSDSDISDYLSDYQDFERDDESDLGDDIEGGMEGDLAEMDDVRPDEWGYYDAWMDAQEQQDDPVGLARQVDRIEKPDEGEQTVVLRNILQHHEMDPALRHLYTTIAYSKAIGLSNTAAGTILEQATAALSIGLGHGDDILSSPTKVSTAMSRLGVHPDDYIERRIVCPNLDCWRMIPYNDLLGLESPTCGSPLPHSDDVCDAELYRCENRVRIPIKVMPFTPLSTWLALFMQDRDFALDLNRWRGDQENEANPDWNQHFPTDRDVPYFARDVVLDGLSEGSAWRSSCADTRRSVFPDNTSSDDPRDRPGADQDTPLKAHSNLPFGLKIVINIDWYVSAFPPARATIWSLTASYSIGSQSKGF